MLESTTTQTPRAGAAPSGATRSRAVPVDGKSIPDAYLRRIEISLDERVFLLKRNGAYGPVTWREVHPKILALFQNLKKAGVGKGDRVCIASQSSPEWLMSDMAVMALGAVTVPIYHSSSVEDMGYILEHASPKLVFAEDSVQLTKLAEAYQQKNLKMPIVVFKEEPGYESPLPTTPFAKYATADGDPLAEFKKSVATIKPEDPCSIVYTSGTTGRPKGAVLTHANFAYELRTVVTEIELHKDDLTVTFLPFAHIFGKIESFLPVFAGITLGFAESINSVAANIQEVKPTLLLSVPRIYEKIYAKIQSEVEASPQLKRNIFKWAVAIGRDVARRRSNHEALPPWLAVRFAVADRLVFAKIRGKLGGNVRLTVSGGAPLARDLCEFLHACGVRVMEGYGLTETTAAVFVNHPDDYQFGTVGRPVGDTEIKIAEDGEILVRGSLIFKEYYKNPEATAEVLSKDGWFATGDIGELDNRGFLRITDRKKELIVTSGGKKVAPQKLENMIKACRFFSNGMVYGDKQKYLVALLTLNEPEVMKWAKDHNVSFASFEELTKKSELIQLVDSEMKEINGQLASFESIKKFAVLPRDFTIEAGEITPSMKLKRKAVTERFRSVIDGMYA